MGKNKLRRFQENRCLSNVIQPTRQEVLSGFQLKGRWRDKFFGNTRPIILELGCGKGEYVVGMGKVFPEKNFIGLDIKGARLWFGAKEAVGESLGNVAFLRTHIELLDLLFDENEVDEIWITFPDPQIKHKRMKHRLTCPYFLEKYRKILRPRGVIHLKTDSEFLYGYTLGLLQGLGHEIITAHHDIYGAREYEPSTPYLREIKTYYELLFFAGGKPITYVKFRLG
ncbi:MAG: tRNA (guanosine(46)-N7)-methyltransferase TrmB [Bergeyella sp.]|nr:tRNA (guanosine(46)-N7)-methyltransferase TrmB [Bergeyella sp.]